MEDFFGEILHRHLPNSQLSAFQRVSGGCINETYKIIAGPNSFFVKWHSDRNSDMLAREVESLKLLDLQSPLIVPKALGVGAIDNKSYLLLEWIDQETPSKGFWNKFGKKLAAQHKIQQEHFGLAWDNYIGSLVQSNSPSTDWADFFIQQRLTPQLKLATDRRLIDQSLMKDFEVLFSKLDQMVPHEAPSLLHGDLWSGNFLCQEPNNPVLIDPAVYFGHRETELAFTTLFGGFDPLFYQSYQEEYPLEPRFEERIDMHNLYPLLVHVNLFSVSYLSGIKQTLKRLV